MFNFWGRFLSHLTPARLKLNNINIFEFVICYFYIFIIAFDVLEKLQLENLQILSVYVKRWWPSRHVIDDFDEVLLTNGTIEEFKEKVGVKMDVKISSHVFI